MIIGLSGYARSGKDTVGRYLVEKHGFAQIAFADALKKVAYTLNPIIDQAGSMTSRLKDLVDDVGWDKAKTNPEVRRILQVLGTECGRDILGPNVWVDLVMLKIREELWSSDVVITDCRFRNEASYVKTNGQLWWIERVSVGPLNSHPSENTLSVHDADRVIVNNGSLDDLYAIIDLNWRH